MKFEILNVEHGFAAYAVGADSSVILFDCGHSASCKPSDYLYNQGIRKVNQLFITNYDEDHIADLPAVSYKLGIDVLRRNGSLNSAQILTCPQVLYQCLC